MAGLTLIFTAFDRNFVLSLGGEVQQIETEEPTKEIVVVESQAITSRPVGFTLNEDEEWEDDDDDSGTHIYRPVSGSLRVGAPKGLPAGRH